MNRNKVFCFFTLLFGTSLFTCIHLLFPILNNIFFLFPIIIVSYFFCASYTLNRFENNTKLIVLISLLLRFLILLWNVYGRDIYCLPGVGTDTEGFHAAAQFISNDLSLLKRPIYGGNYSRYLGLLYYFVGPSYLFGSYMNMIYGVITLNVIKDLIDNIGYVPERTYKITVFLAALEPNNIIICSSLRRESILILFAVVSIWYLFQWIRKNDYSWFLALCFILLSSAIHAGIIGVAVGYVLLILFYRPFLGKWTITSKSIGLFFAVIILSSVVLIRYRGVFLNKILFDDQEYLFYKMERAVGGAAYLRNLEINNLLDFIVYAPLKILYFLLSPMPWNWRGITDILAFFTDSLFYIVIIKESFKGLKLVKEDPFCFALTISSWFATLIYAVGSGNSANAMRHRMKIFPFLVIVYFIVNHNNWVFRNTISNSQASERYHSIQNENVL